MRRGRQPTFLEVNAAAVQIAALGAACIVGAVIVIDTVCAQLAAVLYGLGIGA